jgi:hypothetical protein
MARPGGYSPSEAQKLQHTYRRRANAPWTRAARRLALTDTGRLVLDCAGDLFRIGAEDSALMNAFGRAGVNYRPRPPAMAITFP